MPVIHKRKEKLNLHQYRTWIVDDDPSSRYFRLTNVPEILTAGRNAFLINGSSELVNSTEVLVEIIDSQGNTIFNAPVKNYQEGLARVISIEIYEDTPPGPATITILGEVARNSSGEVAPEEWRGKYNVKWQRQVIVSPTTVNNTPIRLFRNPSVTVEEQLVQYKTGNREILNVSSSDGQVMSGVPSNRVYAAGNPFRATYTVVTNSPFFKKEMEDGVLYVKVKDQTFSASLDTIVSDKVAQIVPGYAENGTFENFSATDFTASFTGSPELVNTQYTRSYADISLNNIATFSGDIYRAKIFVAPVDSVGDFEAVGDFEVNSVEMMVTKSVSLNEDFVRTGYFKNQDIPDSYWVAGDINSMNEYLGQ